MIRLKDTGYQNTAEFLASAIRVAEYYGFSPMEMMPRAARRALPSGAKPDSDIAFARREERSLPSAARRLMGGSTPEMSEVRLGWRTLQASGNPPSVSLELHVAGTASPIAEALLIVVANTIAEEAGIRDRVTAVNNMGSSESCGRYARDVSSYLKKHLESISPTLRPRAALDPLGALVQLIERGHPAVSRAPQSMEYLTEEERRRFWELLECLEVHGLPYELNGHILGSPDCWAHTLFEICATDPETGASLPLAFGGRYDPLASRFARAPLGAAVVIIGCEVRGKSRVKQETPGVPAMYFAHLGLEARRRALSVLETLRRSDIPVHHEIWHERLGEQMQSARRLAVPYLLIMGHKEAVEGTVLVRDISSNSQEAVPLPDLVAYLRHLRLPAVRA